jgi:hypothetical protein
MYPDSAISGWAMFVIAITVLTVLAAWLGAVFYAAREPRHRKPKT